MWTPFRLRLGPTTRLLLTLAGTLELLLLVVALWWWLPPMPRFQWSFPGQLYRLQISRDGTVLATLTADKPEQAELTLWKTASGEKLASRAIQWNRIKGDGSACHHNPVIHLAP